MLKLTFNPFKSLVNSAVYEEAKEKRIAQEVARIKTEVYAPVQAAAPLPKQGRVQCNKPISRPKKQGLTPIQQALKKQEMQEAAERLHDLQYKNWAEAGLREHYSNARITATAEELVAVRTKKYANPVKVK